MRVLRENVIGLPYFSIEHLKVCKGCALGKYTKISFPSSDNRVASILELIHLDLCGLISSVSLCGYYYYGTFIDEFSRRTWIFFKKTKGWVFRKF